MRHFLLSVFLFPFIIANSIQGQTLGWDAGYDGFLDNREYFSINNPQTIFGARAWGEIGADIDKNHSFRVGMNFLKEFGSLDTPELPDLTMYYQYNHKKIDFLIGSFPRRERLHFPMVFLSDTLNYYRPNIEGTFLRYSNEIVEQYVYIDWMSRQTDEHYERFIFGTAGTVKAGEMLFFENYLMMSHLAGKAIPEEGFHLRDNGGGYFGAGINLSGQFPFDSLEIKGGALVSFDRIRGVNPGWQTPAGFLGEATIQYSFMGIHGTYYQGQGHTFIYGDPFYKLRRYGRLDLYVVPLRNTHVNLTVNFSLHFAKDLVNYSQQLLLVMKIK